MQNKEENEYEMGRVDGLEKGPNDLEKKSTGLASINTQMIWKINIS